MGVLLFPVLAFLAVVMFLFAAYLLLGGAGKIMDRLRAEAGPRFLEETVPTLLLWDPARAFPDLSSLCRRTTHSSGLGSGRSHSRGMRAAAGASFKTARSSAQDWGSRARQISRAWSRESSPVMVAATAV